MNAYRAALEALRLSQVEAARLFGVGVRTSHRWASPQDGAPDAVMMQLQAWLDDPKALAKARLNASVRRAKR